MGNCGMLFALSCSTSSGRLGNVGFGETQLPFICGIFLLCEVIRRYMFHVALSYFILSINSSTPLSYDTKLQVGILIGAERDRFSQEFSRGWASCIDRVEALGLLCDPTWSVNSAFRREPSCIDRVEALCLLCDPIWSVNSAFQREPWHVCSKCSVLWTLSFLLFNLFSSLPLRRSFTKE